METNHTNSQPAAAERQPEIRLPNGTTTKGVLLHRGMANLQHDADHADFEPQTKVYLAWLNDLNGNRFGLKITDASDQLLLRQTESRNWRMQMPRQTRNSRLMITNQRKNSMYHLRASSRWWRVCNGLRVTSGEMWLCIVRTVAI